MAEHEEPMADREATTPRDSASWQFQADIARALSQQVRDEELRLGKVSPALDTGRANMLRYVRQVVDHYGALFTRYQTAPPPSLEVRGRQQAEFSAAVHLVQVLLGPAP